MVAAFYSHWTAATWGAVLWPVAPILLGVVGWMIRSRRLAPIIHEMT